MKNIDNLNIKIFTAQKRNHIVHLMFSYLCNVNMDSWNNAYIAMLFLMHGTPSRGVQVLAAG